MQSNQQSKQQQAVFPIFSDVRCAVCDEGAGAGGSILRLRAELASNGRDLPLGSIGLCGGHFESLKAFLAQLRSEQTK